MRIGTRSSTMALAQTDEAAAQLRAVRPALSVEVVRFMPRGDRDLVGKLHPHGGKGGAFVAEIREAMRRGELEAAMHSLKDMPGDEEAPGLVIGAMLARESAEDALVLRKGVSLEEFVKTRGAGAKIGTNSVRRAAFLRRLYPEAEVIHYRGAADTRVRKLNEGAMQRLPEGGEVGPADALVMARCGLERVGLARRITYAFSPDEMLPAVGQGIIAIECREEDWETRERLAPIDDAPTRACALAEREMLWVLNGHCNAPIAGHATLDGGTLILRAAVIALEGGDIIEAKGTGHSDRPRELGRDVGLELVRRGAAKLIEATRL